MRYVSLFSGIEAASMAWGLLGWEPVAFAEIEPFPSAVLASRWPDVPNLGDITKVDWKEFRRSHGAVDVVVGGSPCQSFSVAGLRKGLADPRGNLMLEYLRACKDLEPEWVVWENVPGVLSSDDGRDFAAFQEAVAELWPYGGMSWRVLDAQFFGVAQRRRRVFAVINTRDWRRAAAVLQDRESLRGRSSQSREKRQELARTAGYRAPFHLVWGAGAVSSEHVGEVGAFKHHAGASAGSIGYDEGISPTLTVDHQPCVSYCFQQNQRDEVRLVGGDGDVAGTINADSGMHNTNFVVEDAALAFDTTNITSPDNSSNPQFGSGCHTLSSTAHVPTFALRTAYMDSNGRLDSEEVSPTLDIAGSMPTICVHDKAMGRKEGNDPLGEGVSEELAFTQTAGGGNHVVCTQYGEELAGTLTASWRSSPSGKSGQNIVADPGCMCVEECISGVAVDEELAPAERASWSKQPAVVCMADDAANAVVDTELCGAMKVGGGTPSVACIPGDGGYQFMCSNGQGDLVGSLTARDFKGVGNQSVEQEGKLITQTMPGQQLQSWEGIDPNRFIVRELTPVECERLQGFPDGHTDLTGCDVDSVCGSVCRSLGIDGEAEVAAMRRKVAKWSEDCPKGPRYKCTGNSMAVPVMLWIGQRIEAVEKAVRELG